MLHPDVLRKTKLAERIYETYRKQLNRAKGESLIEWRALIREDKQLWEQVAAAALDELKVPPLPSSHP